MRNFWDIFQQLRILSKCCHTGHNMLQRVNCEKCLLTLLLGILYFLKSSYNRHVIDTFINLPFTIDYMAFSSWLQRPAGYTVMRIVTKLGSFAYHMFFFLSAKVSRLYFYSFLGGGYFQCSWVYIKYLLIFAGFISF